MGTHPNVLLIAVLTPDDLARKTYRAILKDSGANEDGEFYIGSEDRTGKGPRLDMHALVAEGDWEEVYQISTKEGQLLFFDLVTYGYGQYLTWERLEQLKGLLETWAEEMCEKHCCFYEIRVSANYW